MIRATSQVTRAHAHRSAHGAARTMPPLPAPMAAGKAKTPQDVFDSMRDSFRPDKAQGVHCTYQFDLSGPNGGHWNIVVNDGKATIARGSAGNPDVTFITSDEDWVRLSNGDLSGTLAFMAGRLHIKGSHKLAQQLDTMFP